MHHQEECTCGQHGHETHHEEACGCGHHEFHHRPAASHCECACHQAGSGFKRSFISKDEVVEGLEKYLKDLQAEAEGVRERIQELRSK